MDVCILLMVILELKVGSVCFGFVFDLYQILSNHFPCFKSDLYIVYLDSMKIQKLLLYIEIWSTLN